MHFQGDLEGQGPVWGYVQGGMGMVSFALADAAQEAGAVLACGVPVAAIEPEAGVVLEDGTRIRARTVLCNADPKVALCGCSRARTCPPTTARAWRTGRCAARWSSSTPRSTRCPTGPRRRGRRGRRARRSTSPAASRTPSAPSRRASAASPPWASARSTSRPATTRRRRPPGKHLLSVFGQYAPYELAEGTWDSRREEVARQFIDLIDRFAPGFEHRIEAYEVLGPPDIEQRIGLTGGNIFQGEVTPDQMWEQRLTPRTPVPGLYFCGAATHPGGSVIALNGRNAAMAVLADARELAAR